MAFPISRLHSFAVLCALVLATPARAELKRVEIVKRADVLNGKSFGEAGAYEKIHGKAFFAIDPKLPGNRMVKDIDLAPRNKEGKVEFSADFFLLRPKEPSRGNGVVFFDVVNRGRFRLLTAFSDADAAVIKSILPKLFENDASSARPDGSMQVIRVVWWQHNCKAGQYSSAKVHDSLRRLLQADGSFDAAGLEDALDGLKPEIIEGF